MSLMRTDRAAPPPVEASVVAARAVTRGSVLDRDSNRATDAAATTIAPKDAPSVIATRRWRRRFDDRSRNSATEVASTAGAEIVASASRSSFVMAIRSR
jgi:hypothetical protein